MTHKLPKYGYGKALARHALREEISRLTPMLPENGKKNFERITERQPISEMEYDDLLVMADLLARSLEDSARIDVNYDL